MNIAVIKTGGKQYKIKQGAKLEVEKLDAQVGSTISFRPLLVADEAGESVKVGKPEVSGASVEARVLEHGKGDKVHVIKFHRKVRYKRNVGHRQLYTKIEITKILS